MHLTLAFEQGFRFAAKPVTAEVVEQVLSRAIDDLEPTLTRNGYDAGALASQLNTRPSDIRAFLAGTLDAEHTRDLKERGREEGGERGEGREEQGERREGEEKKGGGGKEGGRGEGERAGRKRGEEKKGEGESLMRKSSDV